MGAVAIAAAMPVEQFVRIPLSFPTYTNVLGRAGVNLTAELDLTDFWDAPGLATRT